MKELENNEKKVILSGIKPSGQITIGNYIGALRNWVNIQEEYNCYYFVADLHAITETQIPSELRQQSLSGLAQYIACGINPEKVTFFIQSHVSEHAELAWVFNCLSYMGELSRMTQFKDKSQKNNTNINAGLLTYPPLMAADILLYDAHLVPVGEDQKQHLELTRNLAQRFNNRYSETFVVPEAYIPKIGARIMSLQEPTSKMSKSDVNSNGSIYLLDKKDDIVRKIKRAVTDSESTIEYKDDRLAIKNLINIYSAFSDMEINDIVKLYENKGYGEFKQDLAVIVSDKLSIIQNEYNYLMKNKDYLEQIYREGAMKAKKIASKKLEKVYRKVGFVKR